MKPKTAFIILTASTVLLTFGAGSTHSAIKPRDSEIIRAAYMNGFVAALKLAPEKIQELKGNETLLEKAVEGEADKYVALVDKMNQ